jgi:hypothetical protein
VKHSALLAIGLLVISRAALSQTCAATVPSHSAQWVPAPEARSSPDAALRIMTHLRCLSCAPQVSMALTAGPAPRDMPLGQKTGRDWAQAVYDDPANREGLRRSVLRSALHSAPGCRMQGGVTGVAQIGNLGMVGTRIAAECAGGYVAAGELYSGYDGACQYQVQLVWGPGIQELSPQAREAVQKLLDGIRFGS